MFEIHKAKNKQYYYNAVSGNNQVLWTSETYTRKRDVYRAIRSHKIAVIKGFFKPIKEINDE